MINFFKGIIVGIGGVSPGLSGSVLLVIFGLYEKCIEAIGTIFKDFKKNVLFLIPLMSGFLIGVLLFSKIVSYLLEYHEMYTRYAFLGLVIGTIPLFNKEVKKHGFNKKYYLITFAAFIIGLLLLFMNKNLIGTVEHLNFIQSILLGLAVAASTIVPGVDSAVILSSLGLYEIYVNSLSNLNFEVLIPAGIGLGFGAIYISYGINKLIKNYYTLTFSLIFGLFIAIIPSVLNSSCYLGYNIESFISILLAIIGFFISYFLGKLKKSDEDYF